MKLRYTLLSDEARPPARAHHDDAGFDLHASEEARLGPGERASVGTGVALEIPAGWAGLVLPRSGLAARHGVALVNAPGLARVTASFDERYEARVLVGLSIVENDDVSATSLRRESSPCPVNEAVASRASIERTHRDPARRAHRPDHRETLAAPVHRLWLVNL